MPLSVNIAAPLTTPEQATIGTLALSGGRTVEIRINGGTTRLVGLVAPRGHIGQVSTGVGAVGGGNLSLRAADGLDQADILAAIDTLAAYIRSERVSTDTVGTAEAEQMLRVARRTIVVQNLRAP